MGIRKRKIVPLLASVALTVLTSCQQPLDFPQAAAAPPVANAAPSPAPSPQPSASPKKDASAAFFATGPIPQLKIVLTKEEEQKLRQDQRRYVLCTLIEDGKTTYEKVSVKLKGAAGSFRNLDDKPALTLNMNKEHKTQRFHDLDKFHLNNSVQDDSYLSELLCSQLCREAGCPAARVSHARVWLNDRDLGMYVLKEGFDKTFLQRNFKDASGNLYDGGFLRDIDQDLEKDEGENPDDRSDLKALLAACREGDPTKRWQRIAERLDVDAFLNFTALELMMAHWDGYVQNRNNYRIYFVPPKGQAVFIPHGMDQMFADPNFPVFHHPGAIVVNSVLQNPEWRTKYNARVRELLPLFAPAKLNAKLDAAHDRLRPVFASINEGFARHLDGRTQDMKNRVAQRAQNIRNQMPKEPLTFNKEGWAALDEWYPGPNNGDAKIEATEVSGQALYAIYTGPSNRAIASWRRKVLLAQGTYKLEAQGRVTSVTPLEDGVGKGLGLRLSGGKREAGLVGTSKWEPLSFEFEITDAQREVELVAELRATAGRAWLDAGSLKLVKVK